MAENTKVKGETKHQGHWGRSSKGRGGEGQIQLPTRLPQCSKKKGGIWEEEFLDENSEGEKENLKRPK